MNVNRHLLRILIIAFLSLTISNLKAGEAESAKILTYNVLADPAHAEVRLPAVFKILNESDADIIALQEVAPWFLAELEKQALAKHYHCTTVNGKWAAHGGLLILSKSPITKVTTDFLPSPQRRSYVIAETMLLGEKVVVGVCHLDSPLESGEVRALQLTKYFKMLETAENAIFLGDFNFGDGEQPETDQLRADYVDAWRSTNGKTAGFTWNIEKSHMAKLGSFPREKSRRLDRVLLRSKHFSPVKTEILGDREITGHIGLFPSDHFALLATFCLSSH